MRVAIAEILFLVVPVALLVIAVTRNRPDVEWFAMVNDLRLDGPVAVQVGATLSRTRRSRVRGAWVGLGVGIVVGMLMDAATGLGTAWTTAMCAVGGILVGTFVGIAAAQRTPRLDAGSTRRASLTVREVDAYRTPHGTTLIRIAVVGFLAATMLTLAATAHDVAITISCVVVIVVGALGFVTWARRLSVGIVERARNENDPIGAAVDDVLRSCAVRSIQHATVGVLACGVGLLALLAINTQSYEAVKIDGRTVFTVPDGGRLDSVSEPSVTAMATRTTIVRIRWTDADGVGHTARRTRPKAVYLGFGNYIETNAAIGFGGLGLMLGWVIGIREWSAAAKTWRRPAAPRSRAVATPDVGVSA